MLKKGLITGIILLFIFTSVSPMAFGSDSELLQKDEILENFAFYYYDEYDSSKLKHYKEYFQRNNLEIADFEEITTPVKSSQTSVSSGPMDSPWPMKCHDLHHTSRSPYSTANNSGFEKWRFKCDGVDSPIIGDDGIIYFGDNDWDIYAIYPNGTLKWTYHTGGDITSAPALAEDGTLYVGSWDDSLYAFNSTTGIRKWRFDAGDTIASSPVVGDDGTIYFGTMGTGCNIFAVNPNGTEKWRYHTGYYITCDPAIGDDGTVYCGSGDTYFYAMNPNGTLKWRFKTGHYIKGPASIADDGTVYIGSFDGYLYALYPNNGTMKWKYGAGTETNPSIASDGTIYVGSLNKLHAIYPNGTRKWTFTVGSSSAHITQSSPAISADGTIYVGTQISSVAGGDIIAINSDGTEKWRKRIADDWIRSSPCIAEDGT
ncbi:MAG: PQQ-like beta-propeller repeat protein, partial [Thermoplasmatales archaeon]|nr:PQQ-like beta-propeller repeat protein [Thermoplasmatales archaeon]